MNIATNQVILLFMYMMIWRTKDLAKDRAFLQCDEECPDGGQADRPTRGCPGPRGQEAVMGGEVWGEGDFITTVGQHGDKEGMATDMGEQGTEPADNQGHKHPLQLELFCIRGSSLNTGGDERRGLVPLMPYDLSFSLNRTIDRLWNTISAHYGESPLRDSAESSYKIRKKE
jgi:hypothetical protein